MHANSAILKLCCLLALCATLQLQACSAPADDTQAESTMAQNSMAEASATALNAADNSSKTRLSKNVEPNAEGKIVRPEAEWEALLTEEQFYVTRKAGTERSFTGEYWDFKGDGIYTCICCEQPLFDSQTKFKSGTGWPSYYMPIADSLITEDADYAYGMIRTEVLCSRCDAHLGHLFTDGPEPTGMRYCINSASLDFVAREDFAAKNSQVSGNEMMQANPEMTDEPEAQEAGQ